MWRELPLSLFGRIHLVRMTSFARLLYPLQMLLLLLKHKDVNILNSGIRKFIWRGKCPRIALAKLWLSKKDKGAGLPSIRGYNRACILRHTVDWLSGSGRFSNVEMEGEIVRPWTLQAYYMRNFAHCQRNCVHIY